MKVFKFGGASIKDAEAIRNMAEIVRDYGEEPLVVIVSAMGKTTRGLEACYDALAGNQPIGSTLNRVKDYHFTILSTLFDKENVVFTRVEEYFSQLENISMDAERPLKTYDQIVAFGELMSSTIIHAFLIQQGLKSNLVHAPDLIITSEQFGSGKVDWVVTDNKINNLLAPELAKGIVLTQGYIGGTKKGDIITLGKEGSDYTASIFASCLNASSVTIWKDVPGVLSGDPKLIKDARQVMKLPYKEASEMTYYGASVIHPKTIKPLAIKGIPLIVRSFDDPELEPTVIGDFESLAILPSVIYKRNQCLFSFRVKDYTFVDERNLSKIFQKLEALNISINMMQSSAITVSICFDYQESQVNNLLAKLSKDFTMHYNQGLELITIKNFDQKSVETYSPQHCEILLEQKTRDNYRFLVDRSNEGQ